MQEFIDRILVDEDAVQQRVVELGRTIMDTICW